MGARDALQASRTQSPAGPAQKPSVDGINPAFCSESAPRRRQGRPFGKREEKGLSRNFLQLCSRWADEKIPPSAQNRLIT